MIHFDLFVHFSNTHFQVLEYIVKSYLNGNFHKVSELFEFHDSLVNSISKSVFLLDKLWLSLLLSTSNSWNQIGMLTFSDV